MNYEKMTKIELIRKLMLHEEQFKNTFEQVAVGIAHVGLNGQFIKVNRHFCDITGYSEQEMLKSTFRNITYPDDICMQDQIRKKVLDGENSSYTIEKRYTKKDNSLIWVSLTVTLIRKPGGEPHYFISSIENITERKIAEKRLNAQQEVTKVLVKSSTIKEASPKILQTICTALDWDLGEIWEPDHEKKVLYNTETWHMPSLKIPEFTAITSKTTFFPKTGLPGRVWESAEPLWIADVVNDTNFLRASVADKEGLHGAFGFPIIIGSDVLGTICFFSREIREPDRNLLEMMTAIGRQIGLFIKRIHAEEALLQSERLQSLGAITVGVAHEFNNILNIISGNVQLLQIKYKDNSELMDSLNIISRSVYDGAEITNRMVEFTKTAKDTAGFVSTDMIELINQAIDFTMPRWKHLAQVEGINYHMDTENMKEIPFILCNPTELKAVFVNIINNALDAMPDDGRITFRTWSRENTIFISISDTGTGMPAEVVRNMFDPFFTTRSPVGTGLGLSTAFSIIARHGGNIKVESAVGRGSTFVLQFPLAAKADSPEESPEPKQEIKANSLSILVVDDEGEKCSY